MKTQLTADILYNRHRLSYPQIDSLLGTNNKELYQKDIIKNFKVIREFIKVTDEFRKMDIRFIPLKGPLLSQRIYNDATVRRFHDLDILIDFNNISLIYNYLVKCGYCAEVELSEDKKERLRLYSYARHISFFHPHSEVCFEIHWKITSELKSFNLDFDFNYEQFTINQVFMNREFRVFKNEYNLIYLLIHGSIHRWQRLKWLVDIKDYMLNTSFDWLEINKIAQKYDVTSILPLYNSLAIIFFADPPLFDIKLKVPDLMTRYCEKVIESVDLALPARNIFEAIANSFKEIRYGLLLFPVYDYKIAFLKTKLICYTDSKKIKTTNPMLLILYKPFGYLYRVGIR
ncbi:MAG: nucleotidyltransferase family protein [Mariniphaga sp.]